MTARRELGRVPKVPPICAAIRRAREAAELSQGELARRLGISQSMVNRYERESEPKLSVLVRIEIELDLGRGDLFIDAGYVDADMSVPAAIRADVALDDRAQKALLAAYRELSK